jgi:hypothetical protein
MAEREVRGTASYFTPLFDVILQDPELGRIGAIVFGKVWRYCDAYGTCTASRERMAREVGLSYKTFQRWLTTLCDKGYLEDLTPERRNAPHEYRDTGKVRMVVRVEAEAAPDGPSTQGEERQSAQAGRTESPTSEEVGRGAQAGRTESPTCVKEVGHRVQPGRTQSPSGSDSESNPGRTESPMNIQDQHIDPQTTNKQAADVVAQNLQALAAFGVVTSYAHSREVAALPHVTPELIRAWGAHLGQQAGTRNLPGLLLDTLRAETRPPPNGRHVSRTPYAEGGVFQ